MRRCWGVSEEGTFRLRGSELGRKKREKLGEFPCCPVVRTWHSGCNGLGSIPERFACKGKEFGMMPSSGSSPECGFQALEERVRIGRKQVGGAGERGVIPADKS